MKTIKAFSRFKFGDPIQYDNDSNTYVIGGIVLYESIILYDLLDKDNEIIPATEASHLALVEASDSVHSEGNVFFQGHLIDVSEVNKKYFEKAKGGYELQINAPFVFGDRVVYSGDRRQGSIASIDIFLDGEITYSIWIDKHNVQPGFAANDITKA